MSDNRRRFGFTIVELLVVVLVVGIIAAISVVGYGAWRQQTIGSQLKSDLNGIAAAMESHRNFNSTYPSGMPNGFTPSSGVSISIGVSSDGGTYCAQATSDQLPNVIYYIKPSGGGPTEASCLAQWSAVSAGDSHTCAIWSGKAYCWGNAADGRLGNGQTSGTFTTPQRVVTTTMSETVTDISAGNSHTCAIAGGKAYCWGNPANGRLGNGQTSGTFTTPQRVQGNGLTNNATQISAGGLHTCAIAGDKVYCWGDGSSGKLGLGTTVSYDTPMQLTSTFGGVGSVPKSLSAGFEHTCVMAWGVYCWGLNSSGPGQIGNGAGGPVPGPTQPNPNSVGYADIVSAGSYHTCAANVNVPSYSGVRACWGRGADGRLGTNSTANQAAPTNIEGTVIPSNITQLSAGSINTCALSDDKAYCWGSGTGGQLGIGSTVQYALTPVAVSTSVMSGAVVDISVGSSYACAVADDQVYCWGAAGDGRLGVGTIPGGAPYLTSPTAVASPLLY